MVWTSLIFSAQFATIDSPAAPAEAACPLCGRPSVATFVTTDRNRRIGHKHFHYRRCTGCETLFLSDPPDDLGDYYPSDYYQLAGRGEIETQSSSEAYKLDLVRRLVSSGRMLEIGPGNGAFGLLAASAGFDYTGIEMDSRACMHLQDELGLSMIRSDRPEKALADLPRSDAIVLWHVLEHLPDPWGLLDAAARNLDRGGVLACSMPNPRALQFRILKSRWPHVDAPRHLQLVPLKTLVDEARGRGLALQTTTSTDPGGRYWNLFGWRQFFSSAVRGKAGTLLALTAGTGITALLAPFERTRMRGSTYTALFVKDHAE